MYFTPFSSLNEIYRSYKDEFTSEEAADIAKALRLDFNKELFDLKQFNIGLNVELEHGSKFSETNITNDDPILTGKITLSHLREFPDYYVRLVKLEEEAEEYWSRLRNPDNETREFTLSELSQYDGTAGKPTYVAVNGIVYDVTNNPNWSSGVHFGVSAGKDLTSEFQNCHGSSSILENLPKVGVLKK
ncbi:DUF5661 family protein [Clostridium cylindrosporum]|uniref:Cytochrome b5 heme-binding domain-containing protein n=1 Tax=Clostridium cylindrosporum DSM 605 TaxID=1121307 RepID=A0A0J8DCI0_CLOCY|nr:DUF5661 family protein [Clostridium cylindrosporum]KMT21963.1 hypothetical protein CLCY_3c02340 [Clostridium cylindrosporum DSM 605]